MTPQALTNSEEEQLDCSQHFLTVKSSLHKQTQVSVAHRCAIEMAESEKQYFSNTLPQSLREEVDNHTHDCVAPFKQEELVLGPKLGSGEFSHVYEVSSFSILTNNIAQESSDDLNKEEVEQRLHMKKIAKYRSTDKARYALKHIKHNYLHENGLDDYIQTAGDLALEAEFLAHLNHPNIIKLRGLTHSGTSGFGNGPCGFYLVIDRLFETLDKRIERWHRPGLSEESNSNPAKKSMSKKIFKVARIKVLPTRNSKTKKSSRNENELMDDVLCVALQISAAIEYLHSHSVIFRDLKPDNVGFDVRGDVKIFDFGLARFVPEGADPYKDTYQMSGAGSPRYMAPECLLGESYNLKADVYSFALVVWQMLTGELPYSSAKNRAELCYLVLNKQGQPEIDDCWPVHIKGMMRNSFEIDMEARPKMKFFHKAIQKSLTILRDGDSTGISDSDINRRRSRASFKDYNHSQE